jgi:sporulation protein YlmC with PRC-barrel domain
MARYELGTTVYTTDDVDIGTIDRLIVDPHTGQLQGFVVRKGLVLQRDVVIPAGDVTPDDFDTMNGFLHLTISSRETDRLLAYQEAGYTQPDPLIPPTTGTLWSAPVSYFAPGAQPHREEVHAARDRIAATHPASAILHNGTKVVGRDGTKIGTVLELVANKQTGTVAQLVARRGLLDETEVRIPVQLIDFVTNDTIYVGIDKGRLEQFTYP